MSTALVPVKALGRGKSRMDPALAGAPLAELVLAMLSDVLLALAEVPHVKRRVVVTPDPRVAQAARELGATALLREDDGLNAALDAAAEALAPAPGEAWLVVLGDVAAARPADLEQLFIALGELGGRGVVCAASRDGGSSALLRCPADCVPSLFGSQSAAAHERAARERGVPFRRLELPSLSLDLDTPEDLETLARLGPGPHTARWLASWRASQGASA